MNLHITNVIRCLLVTRCYSLTFNLLSGKRKNVFEIKEFLTSAF